MLGFYQKTCVLGMASVAKNMSYHLIVRPSFVRHFDPAIGSNDFSVHAYGCHRSPGAYYERRHPIEDTWLFCHFYDPVFIREKGHPQLRPPNSWIFWKPGQWRGYGNRERQWRHSFFHLSGARVERVCALAEARAGLPSDARFENLTETFLCELDREATGELAPETRILGNLFENWFLAMRRPAPDISNQTPERLNLVREKLIDGSAAFHSLADLATMAGLSKSHFSARFREAFGEAPGIFQQRWRIERAKGLLDRPGLPIADAAEQLGFSDAFSFSRSFKKWTGISPRAWRAARDHPP